MPKNYEQIKEAIEQGNKMDFGNAMIRNNGVPLDSDSVKMSYIEAVKYAATNPTAYAGQLVSVTEGDKTSTYVITSSPQGKLRLKNGVEVSDEDSDTIVYDVYLQAVCTGKVVSRDAAAFGKNTIAGCKCAAISSWMADGSTITITVNCDPRNLPIYSSNNKKYLSVEASVVWRDMSMAAEDTPHTQSILFIDALRVTNVSYTEPTGTIICKENIKLPAGDVVSLTPTTVVCFDVPEFGDTEYGAVSTAFGAGSGAFGYASVAEGFESKTFGNYAVSFGYKNEAGTYGVALGTGNKAHGRTSSAFGKDNLAKGFGSNAIGIKNKVYGSGSSAKGVNNTAGVSTDTSFLYSHSIDDPVAASANGINTKALTKGSTSQGRDTIAGKRMYRIESLASSKTRITVNSRQGLVSGQTVRVVTDKEYTIPNISVSTAFNRFDFEAISDLELVKDASGKVLEYDENGIPVNYCTVVGDPTLGDTDLGQYAHASGLGTETSATGGSARGTYNIDSPDYIDVVGNGTSDSNRSNAYTLDRQGNATFAGTGTFNGGLTALEVKGDSTLSGGLSVTGAATLGSGLSVTGTSTLSGDLEVTGDTFLRDSLQVSGAVYAQSCKLASEIYVTDAVADILQWRQYFDSSKSIRGIVLPHQFFKVGDIIYRVINGLYSGLFINNDWIEFFAVTNVDSILTHVAMKIVFSARYFYVVSAILTPCGSLYAPISYTSALWGDSASNISNNLIAPTKFCQ